MEKLVFIARDFGKDLGTDMHYQALCDICGKENIFVFDLFPGEPAHDGNYIAFGKYANPFDRVLRWAQGNTMFLSDKNIAQICETIRSNGVKTVFIERQLFAKLIKKIRETCPGVRTITFYHDINAILYPQWIQEEKRKRDIIEYKIGIKQERLTVENCDVNLVFNQRDAALYREIYGKEPEGIIPLPAPTPEITPEERARISAAGEVKKLLFVGKGYRPNFEGIDWFCSHVLGGIHAPIELQLVGRGMEQLAGKYDDDRVKVIGGVDDLGSYYKDADIVIAPLFSGGGMKTKTAEAISYGKTFIGTVESWFGFWEEMTDGVKDRVVFKSDSPEEWSLLINKLATGVTSKFDEELFAVFENRFSCQVIREQLREYLGSSQKAKKS